VFPRHQHVLFFQERRGRKKDVGEIGRVAQEASVALTSPFLDARNQNLDNLWVNRCPPAQIDQ
jgi:hypothetical protein